MELDSSQTLLSLVQIDTALNEGKTAPYFKIGSQNLQVADPCPSSSCHFEIKQHIIDAAGIDWLVDSSAGDKMLTYNL